MSEQFFGNPTCPKCGCTYTIGSNHKCGMDELDVYKSAIEMSKSSRKKLQNYIGRLEAAFAYLEDVAEDTFYDTEESKIVPISFYLKEDVDVYKDKVREIFAEINAEYFL